MEGALPRGRYGGWGLFRRQPLLLVGAAGALCPLIDYCRRRSDRIRAPAHGSGVGIPNGGILPWGEKRHTTFVTFGIAS